jgi:hypothetical protein
LTDSNTIKVNSSSLQVFLFTFKDDETIALDMSMKKTALCR